MMAVYRLSKKAAADLDGIHEYSVVTFGTTQARNYLNRLHERFEILAQQPMLGRQEVKRKLTNFLNEASCLVINFLY